MPGERPELTRLRTYCATAARMAPMDLLRQSRLGNAHRITVTAVPPRQPGGLPTPPRASNLAWPVGGLRVSVVSVDAGHLTTNVGQPVRPSPLVAARRRPLRPQRTPSPGRWESPACGNVIRCAPRGSVARTGRCSPGSRRPTSSTRTGGRQRCAGRGTPEWPSRGSVGTSPAPIRTRLEGAAASCGRPGLSAAGVGGRPVAERDGVPAPGVAG